MPDAATIIALVGGAVGVLGGGGSAIVTWQRGRREHTLTIWDTYEREFRIAERHDDTEEAERVDREYKEQLRAWRAQQGVEKLAPREISAAREEPSLSEQEVEQLRTLLAQAQSLSPALLSADEYFLRGNAYYGAGQFQEALPAYDRALQLRPDDARIVHNRAVALHMLGRFEEALAGFDRALRLRPDDPDTYYSRAWVFALQAKGDQAIDDLRRAIDGDPKYREMARTDSDFDGIRDDPRFRALVGEEEPPPEGEASA